MNELGTRAVLRRIEPGSEAICPGCNERVKFNARQSSNTRLRIVANVYVDGRWDHIEEWHYEPCYREAGAPHGEPVGKIA